MTIKQLRYLVAVTDNQFNISATADILHTSQPGISKQIKSFEETMDCEVFLRSGNVLRGLTEKGAMIIQQARVVLAEYENLQRITTPQTQNEQIVIASTSTQTHYVLLEVMTKFHKQYPNIKLVIHDGNMDQLIDIAKQREADCIILSGVNDNLKRHWFPEMLMIPCYEWNQILVCPKEHPLTQLDKLSVQAIADYPIITYPTSKLVGSAMTQTFHQQDLCANIIATSNDPKTIKNYVESGMGIGILAPMAFDSDEDSNLVAISLQNLLPKCTTIIAVERHNILKPYVYQFIKYYAPHLSAQSIESAIAHTGDIQPSNIQLTDSVGTWEI